MRREPVKSFQDLFQDLIVYTALQKAHKFVLEVYRLSRRFQEEGFS